MPDVIETDLTTDPPTIIERDYTPEEKQQRAQDIEAGIAENQQRMARLAAEQQIRAAAIAHAKSLGFTDEMISVMYPTLVEE